MAEHNYVGQLGENMARDYLLEKGYKILEQNYKTKFAEIDIIAKKDALIFVEVRTKIGEHFGSPEDTINRQKLYKVLQNSRSYMGFIKWTGPARIDAVCIVLNPDFSVKRLTHHENIVS